MPPENTNPIEHQNIPVAHQGLHDFLYSAADEHEVETTAVPVPEAAVDTIWAVTDWCDLAQNAKVAGVYAVLDRDRQTQFIGCSRNVALSLRSHLTQKGEAVCAFVRVQPFKFPKRDAMAALRDEWIAALPSPPPGNGDGTWAGTIREAATQVMSAAEREAYEAKKLKLRRAMADGSLSQEPDQAEAKGTGQPADLAAAVTDDNWSTLVREQTQETQA
ncbi:MAG: GIY-YIG nuclease family protein [Cyanobacteria bacterium]|nr:GIY-YIG nuclease family protein [Cyanobacteriota bacterium]MDA0867348.1 GIY-YIG nuclease family protein [Cyanobacteriota bacterium]